MVFPLWMKKKNPHKQLKVSSISATVVLKIWHYIKINWMAYFKKKHKKHNLCWISISWVWGGAATDSDSIEEYLGAGPLILLTPGLLVHFSVPLNGKLRISWAFSLSTFFGSSHDYKLSRINQDRTNLSNIQYIELKYILLQLYQKFSLALAR